VTSKVVVLKDVEALWLCKDAKLVSFRWDLIPWSLVLDMDSPIGEITNAPIRRAWMVFVGISEFSWTVASARLVNGLFATNWALTSELPDGYHEYSLPLLTPKFDAQNKMASNPHNELKLTAKRLIGAASTATAYFGQHGPNRDQRDTLATEEDFLNAIGDVSASPVIASSE
jgi:hypothetical protein